jgi:hypothetical protein
MNNDDRPRDATRSFLDSLKLEASDYAKKPQLKIAYAGKQKPRPIDEIIRNEEVRNKKIDNDNKEKDQRLKEWTLTMLFTFLSAETALIFVFAFFQGFKVGGFSLDEWSFRLVLVGTLGQITAMLTIAVRHLFPKK